jgi:hypothetical protein
MNGGVDRHDPAEPLDVDAVRRVHHNLADVGVAEQRLEWAVAQDLVTDLGRDPVAVDRAELRLVLVEDVLQGVPDALLQHVHRALVVQLGAEDVLQLPVDPAADVGQWARRCGQRWWSWRGCARWA